MVKLDLEIDFRECTIGEIQQDDGSCDECAEKTYGLLGFDECKLCPEDQAKCPGKSVLILKEGYWRPANDTDDIYACPLPDICLGGFDSECETPYTGRLCTVCPDDHFHSALYKCSECPESSLHTFTLICLYIGGVSLLGTAVLFFALQHKDHLYGHILLKILINYMQFISLIRFFNMNQPQTIYDMLGVYGIVTDYLQLNFSLSCILDKSTIMHYELLLVIVIPITVVLIFTLFWTVVAKVFHRKTFTRVHLQICIKICFFYMHMNIVKPIILFVSCHPMEDGTSWLVGDYEIECWTGEHYNYLVSLWPFGLLWAIGIPIWFWATIKKLKFRDTEQDAGGVLRVFCEGYKTRFRGNDVRILLKRCILIMVGATLAYYTSLVRGIAGFLIITIGFFYHYKNQPFRNPTHNSLETQSNFAILVTIYCALFFAHDADEAGFGRTIATVVVFLVNCIFYIAWLIAFVGFYRRLYKTKNYAIAAKPFMSVKTIEILDDKSEPIKMISREPEFDEDEGLTKPPKKLLRRQSMKEMIQSDLFSQKVIMFDG